MTEKEKEKQAKRRHLMYGQRAEIAALTNRSNENADFEITDMASHVVTQGFGMKMGAFGLVSKRQRGQARSMAAVKRPVAALFKLRDLEELKAK